MPIVVAVGERFYDTILVRKALAGMLMSRNAGRVGENWCGVGRRNWVWD